jgi:hypothetical protein
MSTLNTTYVSEYGSITVLNRTNYATWKPDTQAVLLAGNAYDIATGTAPELAGGKCRLD